MQFIDLDGHFVTDLNDFAERCAEQFCTRSREADEADETEDLLARAAEIMSKVHAYNAACIRVEEDQSVINVERAINARRTFENTIMRLCAPFYLNHT